jgi:hypothetical protein
MGFFGVMGRVLAGKPAYTPADVEAQKQADQQSSEGGNASSEQSTQTTAPQQPPAVMLGRVECVPKNDRVEVWVDVINQSQEPVFFDDMTVLGERRELQRLLRPGETHQELVYTGPALSGQPQGYAQLKFRRQTDGDYFMNHYQYYCVRQDNGTYFIGEFRPVGHTKEI